MITSKSLARRIVNQRLDEVASYIVKMRKQYDDVVVNEAIDYISSVLTEIQIKETLK